MKGKRDMKNRMMVLALCGLFASMDALCAHPTLTKNERDKDTNQRYFDLIVSMKEKLG